MTPGIHSRSPCSLCGMQPGKGISGKPEDQEETGWVTVARKTSGRAIIIERREQMRNGNRKHLLAVRDGNILMPIKWQIIHKKQV